MGAWRLLSVVDTLADGSTGSWMGTRPEGMIVYDASGVMTLQFARDPRAAIAAGPDTADAAYRDAYLGFYSYWASWTADSATGTVRHHVEASLRPGESGRDYVRQWRVEGDRLVLWTRDVPGGRARVRVLTWERMPPR